MKQGKSLNELAMELTRIQETAKDYIVPVQKMKMNEGGAIEFQNGTSQTLTLNNWSAGQIATYAEIPKQYFDRIRLESPKLLSENVNHSLARIESEAKQAKKTESRMIRTLDGNIRAFLSSRYRRLDSFDLLNETLPTLIENKFQVVSSEITERRLYLKCVTAKIEGEVAKGDVVQYGVMISTSDVGAGSLRIEPFLNRLVCLNGMIMATTMKQRHLGTNQAEREVMELLTDKTRELNDKAFFATVRDVLLGTMKPEIFQREIEKLKVASEQKITNFDLDKVVELSMEQVGVKGDNVKSSILQALASGNEGAGLTQWGLANSFTRAAQAADLDYDTATDLERAGGEIITLNAKQWKSVAQVA